ncbi:hypothetical protein [Tessaracoccus antarcticus]|uniref:Uncharacterized protein n=1 Tax=Tessaracoccus antarcticus TaxID=2479848 RepID=A0A3M0FYX5_9ACTN|nr:hypothetical protein [Tessaracoccus antarcticus]RMB57844.1 hypothetical protein EAX62_15430 [Tessaracoccus antarcticus]
MIALLMTRFPLLLMEGWEAAGGAAQVVMAGTAADRGTVCPVAPEGAQPLVDQFIGWFVWFIVWVGFPASILASIGAILVGKLFSMPHVGKGGLIGLFVILGAALLFLVVPGIVAGFIGNGCIRR